METIGNLKKAETQYILDEKMKVLVSKLDEAIEDVENNRVISEEELWREIGVM